MLSQTQLTQVLNYRVFKGDLKDINSREKLVINTINPHSYVVAKTDLEFQSALKNSDVLIPDGIGIVLADRLLNNARIKKIAGADLHRHMLKYLNNQEGSCFYLGSSPKTLRMIKKKIAMEYPKIKVGFYSPPYTDNFTSEECRKMLMEINKMKPDALFVGMTAPKQEKWVYRYKNEIKAKFICSIGAVFDFYSGNKKRASQFWIGMGLEWLPRLLREPRRMFKRNFVSTPVFLWDVILNLLARAILKNTKSMH